MLLNLELQCELVLAALGTLSAWVVEAWPVPWQQGAGQQDVVEGPACCVQVAVVDSCHLLFCVDPYTNCYLSCVDYDCSTSGNT